MEGEWVCDGELKDSSNQVIKPSDAVLNACVEKTFAKGGAFLYKDVSYDSVYKVISKKIYNLTFCY